MLGLECQLVHEIALYVPSTEIVVMVITIGNHKE